MKIIKEKKGATNQGNTSLMIHQINAHKNKIAIGNSLEDGAKENLSHIYMTAAIEKGRHLN